MLLENSETKPPVFLAYPAEPAELSATIELAINIANRTNCEYVFRGWPENDIAGRPLIEPILSGINEAAFVIADITLLNFNVTYEIGFAIGSAKRAVLIRNEQFQAELNTVKKVGIFDTLGYLTYTNAESLKDIITAGIDPTPIETRSISDLKAPVYMLETPHRGDAMSRIISRIKKARLQYRSFNPSEDTRMAALEAISHVASAHGVLVPLLPPYIRDAEIHNIRAAFVAGLAHGMELPTLILQSDSATVPIDIRDSTKFFRQFEDIDEHINEFALEVVASIQKSDPLDTAPKGKLAKLEIGDPMAENEFQKLDRYYLQRDEYTRTIRGDANIVVGRKGTGKTALFSQVRNALRKDRNMIVVDLKPEGYQLVKLREIVLDYLSEGAKIHLLTAFWEYILLLEVAYKLLEKDKQRHMRDHRIFPHYVQLKELYFSSQYATQGDFSERLIELSSLVADKYQDRFGTSSNQRLTTNEVTEVVYAEGLRDLFQHVSEYLDYKSGAWILFDNLDKGWSVPGPDSSDILILRCLIDAARKIQRDMQRKSLIFESVVFIRNDVYQLLMKESSDFGKEMRVSLDWSDSEMLREMIRLRLVQNGYEHDADFHRVWASLCVSHYLSEETSQFMIDRCLMRPRNLLKIFSHCKGSAVNFHHERIEADDIEKGMLNYSNDLLIEADQELASIEPDAQELIYHFIGEDWKFSREELMMILGEHALSEEKFVSVIHFFLYFGFFGIRRQDAEPLFIFDVGYDMKRLEVFMRKYQDNLEFTLNPAFWPALGVGPT